MGDPAAASDEATNDDVQECERKEQVNWLRKQEEYARTAEHIAEDFVNFKEGHFHAELPSKTVTRKANDKQPDELPNSDELQTMPREATVTQPDECAIVAIAKSSSTKTEGGSGAGGDNDKLTISTCC